LGEAERSLGALLGRLPVTVSAASLEGIVGAATNVSDRALVVIAKLGTAIYALRDHVVDETLRSLGALLGRNPRAILTANLDSVVGTLLSVDGRAMVLVTLDSRDTIACAFGGEVSRASRELGALLNLLPIGAVNAMLKSIVVAAVKTSSTRVSHEEWTVVCKSEWQGHCK
jgi:hypothetical protein